MITFFRDSNDQHSHRLLNILSEKTSTAQFLFSELGNNVDLIYEGSSGNWELKQESRNSVISNQTFKSSKLVFFIRFLPKPTSLILSKLKNRKEKDFAEREWNAFIFGLLLSLESEHPNIIWFNPPSSQYLSFNKFYLLNIAKKIGLKVPNFKISNVYPQLFRETVIKSINTDQFIKKNLRVPTYKIDEEFRKKNTNSKFDIPTFFQDFVKKDYELRVYYILGDFVTLRLVSKNKKTETDIRLEDPKNIEVELINCPLDIRESIDIFCKKMNLNYCCFDFIYSTDRGFLVDINPNGSWVTYEDDFALPITKKFADIVLRFLELHTS